ncbi:hypothetical protein B0I37DRAFT_361546 [Chaetomium sp. MPI-CAGE-AT-0009]|nr:hypothetical protein B0I37DRAFT_361546 [Chaetomium sp. MPI-CAGE-AT-0009]
MPEVCKPEAVWPVEFLLYRSMLCVIHWGPSGNGRAHCVKSLSTSVGGTWRVTTGHPLCEGGRSGRVWCVTERDGAGFAHGQAPWMNSPVPSPSCSQNFFSFLVPQNPPPVGCGFRLSQNGHGGQQGPLPLRARGAVLFVMNLWANKNLSQQGRSDRDAWWDSRDATWTSSDHPATVCGGPR